MRKENKVICQDYYKLGDLRLHREYILRHTETTTILKKASTSRRGNTHAYFLTVAGKRIRVCRKFFLRTLGISEKAAHTAVAKLTETEKVEPVMRRGKQSEKAKARDDLWRQEINKHIERFPRVE